MLGAKGFPAGLDIAVFLCCMRTDCVSFAVRGKLYFHLVGFLMRNNLKLILTHNAL